MNWISDCITDYPDLCRSQLKSLKVSGMEEAMEYDWWKSTFSSSDPLQAALFTKELLDGEYVTSPFPWPPEDGCIIAQWVQLPGTRGFQMHFVNDSHIFPKSDPSV